jgi:predicted lipoprotein with Yx(FWY)xxD motif
VNMKMSGRLARRVIIALATVGVAAAAYAALPANKTLITSGGPKIEDEDKYIVPQGSPEEANGNDPRAERYFTKKIPITEANKNYEFTANYFISSANDTTIAQLLNDSSCTTSGCDRYKPVLFIVATKQSNGKYKICSFQSCKSTWSDIDAGFKMTIKTSGKSADVTIAGQKKTFDLINAANGAYRPSGAQEMRFGAYHHHLDSSKKAASEAKVRVYNIVTAGF